MMKGHFLILISTIMVQSKTMPDQDVTGWEDTMDIQGLQEDGPVNQETLSLFNNLLEQINSDEMKSAMPYLKHWTCLHHAMPLSLRKKKYEHDLVEMMPTILDVLTRKFQALLDIVNGCNHRRARDILDAISYGRVVASKGDWSNLCYDRYNPLGESSADILRFQYNLDNKMLDMLQSPPETSLTNRRYKRGVCTTLVSGACSVTNTGCNFAANFGWGKSACGTAKNLCKKEEKNSLVCSVFETAPDDSTGKDFFKIVNTPTGKVAEAYNGNWWAFYGSKIYLEPDTGADHQLWYEDDDGVIRNKDSGLSGRVLNDYYQNSGKWGGIYISEIVANIDDSTQYFTFTNTSTMQCGHGDRVLSVYNGEIYKAGSMVGCYAARGNVKYQKFDRVYV